MGNRATLLPRMGCGLQDRALLADGHSRGRLPEPSGANGPLPGAAAAFTEEPAKRKLGPNHI